MQFWKGLANIAQFIFHTVEEMNRDAMAKKAKAEAKQASFDLTKRQFANRNTQDLVNTLKSNGIFGANDMEKRAAYEILKERGIIPEKPKNNTEQ